MSGHKDATGHLLSLRSDIPYDWFSFVCDLALAAYDDSLTASQTNQLKSYFFGNEKYKPLSATSAVPSTTTTTTAPPTVAHLKELGDSSNFKKLSSTLTVHFDKRITLIFGTNGAGKSSICEAIKMIASPESPEAPLRNVYGGADFKAIVRLSLRRRHNENRLGRFARIWTLFIANEVFRFHHCLQALGRRPPTGSRRRGRPRFVSKYLTTAAPL